VGVDIYVMKERNKKKEIAIKNDSNKLI